MLSSRSSLSQCDNTEYRPTCKHTRSHSDLANTQGRARRHSSSSRPIPSSDATTKDKTGSSTAESRALDHASSSINANNQQQIQGLASLHAIPSDYTYSLTRFTSKDILFPGRSSSVGTSTQDTIKSHTTLIKRQLDDFDKRFDQK
jgi:hypothetical protein